ncbi:MAG: SDR family NAD(P)-dependent oxidoreductase [Bacteroidales bacterium]|nr:SDR family NAD(P)-dependent oxidoreductase [Bacteroidales bacterium]
MKTALITGGSSGIGLEYSREFASRGYSLALVSNREEELASASASLASEYGITVHTLCADLSDPGSAESVLAWCDSLSLEVDVLVNNAGMFFMEYLGPGNLARARRMLALHVETPTALCVLIGARMKERGEGYILNMSSMTAGIPAPGIAVYSASKAYLKSFGRSLSYEMRPYGVKVTTVCPAAIDTGLYPIAPGLRRTLRRLGVIRSPRWLVRRAVRALFRGRRTISPGLMNAVVPALVALLPPRLKDRLGKRWIDR